MIGCDEMHGVVMAINESMDENHTGKGRIAAKKTCNTAICFSIGNTRCLVSVRFTCEGSDPVNHVNYKAVQKRNPLQRG